MKKRNLFRGKLTVLILAALGSCAWGGITVSADYTPVYGNTVNMTNRGDLSIDQYKAGQNTLYTYGHDASDPTQIKGGSITVKSADSQSQIYLRTDSSGIDINNSDTVTNVLNKLANQLTYSDYNNNKYNLQASAEIAEGLTSSSFIDTFSGISFDQETGQGYVKRTGTVNHIYTDPITGDPDRDTAYKSGIIFNSATANYYDRVKYDLRKGPDNTSYFAIMLRPAVNEEAGNASAGVIQPAEGKDFSISLAGGSWIGAYPSTTIIDVSDMHVPNGTVYGIYNAVNSEIYMPGYGNLTIQGEGNNQYIGGIYAGNQQGTGTSIVHSESDITIYSSKNPEFTAVKAGRNGIIYFDRSGGELNISSQGNTITGIEAEDGGVVNVGSLTSSNRAFGVAIDTHGGKALWAKDGGIITIGQGSTYLENINGDIITEGTGKISDIRFQNGTWVGNLDADSNVSLWTEIWNGNLVNSDSQVSLSSQSIWNGTIQGNGGTISNTSSLWNDSSASDITLASYNGSSVRGLRGVITKKQGNITFKQYSGDTIIGYEHDTAHPDALQGPKVTVESADEGSAITLRTDSSGIDLKDSSLISQIFQNMAKHLTYENYTKDERNLNGRLEIAEGLTIGTQALGIGDITFDEETGSGTFSGTVLTPYNSPVTGDLTKDTLLADIGSSDGNTTTYNFTDDTYINNTINISGATPDPSNMKYAIAVNPDAEKQVILDLHGHNLSIENNIGQGKMAQSTSAVLYALNQDASITINNPGCIDLSTFSAAYYAGGIAAGDRYARTSEARTVTINNDQGWDHAVKIRGTMGMGGTSAGSIFNVNWTGIKTFNHGHVDITGYVDISSYGAWSVNALGGDGWVHIGGGKISSTDYTAIDAYSKGTINLNSQGTGEDMTAGSNVLMVDGNMKGSGQWVGSGSGGYINAAFTTSDSYWNGLAAASGGWISVALRSGAVWTNQDGGFRYGSSSSFSADAASTVDYLYGSLANQEDGVIYQKQDGDITVNHYQGSTIVYYDHNSSNPIQMTGGDFVVESASKNGNDNAVITMKTDNSGIDTKDSSLITRVLNSLAGKLIYDGYTSGERNLTGYAEISEGLTSSSILKKESIIFDENSGAGRVSKDPLGQTKTLFETSLTGDNSADTEYKRAGVLKDGSYTFSDATVIQGGTKSVQGGNFDKTGIMAAIPASGAEQTSKDITVNAGQGLHIDMSKTQGIMRLAGVYTGNGAQLLVNGALSVNVVNSFTNGSALGIAQDLISSTGHRSAVTVNGDMDISIKNQITDGTGQLGSFTPRSETIVGIRNGDGSGSSITVNGMADIDVEGTGIIADNKTDSSGFIAVRGGVVKAQKVAIGDDTFLNNHALAAYAGTIYAGMEKDESGAWNPGTSRVEMEGNILTMRDLTDTSGARSNLLDGTVNLALVTPNSYWKGIADNGGTDKLGTLNLALQNGGLWINEKQGGTYDYSNQWDSSDVLNGTWDGVSHVTTLTGGADERARGIVSQTEDTPISIDHYSGHTLVVYGHSTSDPTQIIGGSVTVKSADKESVMTLMTDRSGIDLDNGGQVRSVLDSLAHKLIYQGAVTGSASPAAVSLMAAASENAENHLTGNVAIGEGLTAPWASYKVGDIAFSAADGIGSLAEDSVTDSVNNPVYIGSYETLIMSGAKSAMASSAMMWRGGLQDMQQRMGDLHSAPGESGAWANVYGGKSELNQDSTMYKTSYTAYQAGYDIKAGPDWRIGTAISYTKGNGDYVLGGDGDLRNTVVSLYGTWMKDSGDYMDIIVKGGNVKNDYTVYNDMGHRVEGDYKTHGYSVSAEYGKRIQSRAEGIYIEPQAQLIWGRLNGKKYSASSDMLDGSGQARTLDVDQKAFNSFLGRIGIGAGKVYGSGSSLYIKASLLHEFDGTFKSGFSAEDTKETRLDLGGSWANVQLGGTIKMANDSYFYGTVSKNFGNNDAEDSWQINGGFRYSF